MPAPWLLERLACPLHGGPLVADGDDLRGHCGCRYPVVHSVPVLLPPEARDFPHPVVGRTLDAIADGSAWRRYGSAEPPPPGIVDDWVSEMVGATNSGLYAHLVGRLPRYPIPRWQEDAGHDPLLDLGCGWGRWSLAAARAGRTVIGLDPSLPSALAATRVARQLGLRDVHFVVGDACRLPLAADTVGEVFSYSVLQHFPEADLPAVLDGLRRCVRPGGRTRLHMVNALGLRGLQVQLARGFRTARQFEVRYWRPERLLDCFGRHLGPSSLEVGSFFVQARREDADLLRPAGQRWLAASDRLVAMAKRWPWLARHADNLFVVSQVGEGRPPEAMA